MLCFTARTPIRTDKGLVPIEQIKVGDEVLSYDEKTKQFEYKAVAQTFTAVKENIIKIKIRGEKLLTTTTEHPFYVKKAHKARDGLNSESDEEGEWLTAAELKVGQKVLRPDGKWTRITRLVRETTPTLVYNLEVEGNHNYFVGEIGVLSHNCDWSSIKLIGEKGLDLWRNARSHLARVGGSAEELNEGMAIFTKQINNIDPSWGAFMTRGTDGSYVWTGANAPFIFVIAPDGKMYEHRFISDAARYVNGVIEPIYENMRRVQ